MSESNNVYENFEDALFRLIMDRVAVVEGERLLRENEELKHDPDAAVPKEVQQRCLHSIRKSISRRNRKAAKRTAQMIARFIPIAAIVALLMGLVAYAAFPSFRATILNLLMTEHERYTTWEYKESDELPPVGDGLSFEIDLPDEYYLVKSEKTESSEFAMFQSRSDSNAIIEISLQYGEMFTLKSDNEDLTSCEELLIQNCPALLIEKDGYLSLIVNNVSVPYFFVLNSNSIGRDVLCEIAENIIINN